MLRLYYPACAPPFDKDEQRLTSQDFASRSRRSLLLRIAANQSVEALMIGSDNNNEAMDIFVF